MRKKPGAVGFGKSYGANRAKTAAHHHHTIKQKTAKTGLKTFSKAKGTLIVGNVSGVGVRGWNNG